jgi:hypothetical protein
MLEAAQLPNEVPGFFMQCVFNYGLRRKTAFFHLTFFSSNMQQKVEQMPELYVLKFLRNQVATKAERKALFAGKPI